MFQDSAAEHLDKPFGYLQYAKHISQEVLVKSYQKNSFDGENSIGFISSSSRDKEGECKGKKGK